MEATIAVVLLDLLGMASNVKVSLISRLMFKYSYFIEKIKKAIEQARKYVSAFIHYTLYNVCL